MGVLKTHAGCSQSEQRRAVVDTVVRGDRHVDYVDARTGGYPRRLAKVRERLVQERRLDDVAPGDDRPDGVDEERSAHVGEEVAGRPGFERAHDQGRIPVPREHDDRHRVGRAR